MECSAALPSCYSSLRKNGALGCCLVSSQELCLLPSTPTSSCQSTVRMSSMPTVAKTWVTWTPTSLLWQKKPISRWPGEKWLCSGLPEKGHEGECLPYKMVRLGPEKLLEAELPGLLFPLLFLFFMCTWRPVLA